MQNVSLTPYRKIMKLSVVMSTYKNEDTISQTIESVLCQAFEDFEFIIVNDGSTDASGKIIRDYQNKDKRVVVIEQENMGLTKSLNRALEAAQGEYVARHDADDVSYPERFSNQIGFLEEHKNVGFVGCYFEVIDEAENIRDRIAIKKNSREIAIALKKANIFCHGSMMFRRSLLKKVSGYRDFFKYSQDYDLYLRLMQYSKPGIVNKVLYKRRESLEGVSVARLTTQLAYASLAKESYRLRASGQDDSYLLNLDNLNEFIQNNRHYDFVLPFMQALKFARNNSIIESRDIIKKYLFPVAFNKWKFYLLWLVTYLPFSVRRILAWAKAGTQKMRNDG